MSIPRTVLASKAVARSEHYEGEFDLAQLKRLEAVANGRGRVHADWRAGQDDAGHPEVLARIDGAIELSCQRCLSPFQWAFDLNVQLKLVQSDDEAARLLQDCEPYEVQNDELPLREMTEDEVLLALPLMPRCKTCENTGTSVVPPLPDEPEGSNPFAALKKLKS